MNDLGQARRQIRAAMQDGHGILQQDRHELLGRLARKIVNGAAAHEMVKSGAGGILIRSRLGFAEGGDLLGGHEGGPGGDAVGRCQIAQER